MKSKTIIFVLAFLIWCMLVWVPGWQQLVVGVVVAFFVTLLMNGFFTGKAQFLKRPICYWYFLGRYVPRFLWECFKANIDVAYRVLHPALPINPGIVKVKTVLKSDVGLTFLANSITLTPGTMTVDIDKDNGVLYIHCINVEKTDVKAASKIIVEKFEKILVKIFE